MADDRISGWQRAKGNLFREPRRGSSDRVGFLFAGIAMLMGVGFVVYGLFFAYEGPYWHGLPYVAMGVFFSLFFGVAEFLPRSRKHAAGWIRIMAFVLSVALLAAVWAY